MKSRYLIFLAIGWLAGCGSNVNDPASDYVRCPDIAVIYDLSRARYADGGWEVVSDDTIYESARLRLFLGPASAICSYKVDLSTQQAQVGEVVGAGVVSASGLMTAEISLPVGVEWLNGDKPHVTLPDLEYFVILLDPKGKVLEKNIYSSATQAPDQIGKALVGSEDLSLTLSLSERLDGLKFQMFIGLQPKTL